MTNIELRAICVDHALAIIDTQVDFDEPILLEEVIDEAEILFVYIKTGRKPKSLKVTAGKGLED